MHNFGYQEDEHQVTMMEFSIWRRILVYTRPYGKKIGIAVGLSLLISLTSLALPYLTKNAIDQYITNEALPMPARLSGLLSIAGLFLVRAPHRFCRRVLPGRPSGIYRPACHAPAQAGSLSAICSPWISPFSTALRWAAW